MTLSLNPPVEQEDPLSLVPPGIPYAPVTGPIALERSHKYDFALAHNSPGRETVENNITTGMEDNLRSTSALIRERELQAKKKKDIENTILAGNVTPQQAVELTNQYNTPVKVDPSIVMESAFADEYTKMVERLHRGATIGSPELIKIQAEAEADSATLNQISYEDFKTMTGPFKRIVERNLIAQKELEDLQARNKNLSTIEYGINFIGSMLPVINSLASNETLWGAILPGSSIERERDKYWSFSDPVEAQKWLNNRIKTIEAWNPLTAVEYAQGIVSTSYEDKWVRNTFSLGGATLTAGQVAAARVLANNVKALGRGVFEAETVAAATGDLDTAAQIISAKHALNNRDKFDLTYEIKQLPLLANPRPIFDLNDSAMASDRRLKMATIVQRQGAVLMEGILDAPRLQRLDESYHVTMRDQTKQRILNEFPSVQDYVNNTQLHYSPINNSYYAEVIVTNRDGLYFRNATQGERALQNMGIDYTQARIVQTEDVVDIAPIPIKRFTTSKGSTYKVNEDGTTNRNKAARAEHPGDEGPQPRSKKTVYITQEDANRIAPPSGQWRYEDKDGRLTLLTRTVERPWGKVSEASVAYSTTPRVGLVPVEFWRPKKLQGSDTWGKVHFGNEITHINQSAPKPTAKRKFEFNVQGQKVSVDVTPSKDGKILKLDWVGVQQDVGRTEAGAKSIGAKDIKEIYRQLGEIFPDAERFQAIRISGAKSTSDKSGARFMDIPIPRRKQPATPVPGNDLNAPAGLKTAPGGTLNAEEQANFDQIGAILRGQADTPTPQVQTDGITWRELTAPQKMPISRDDIAAHEGTTIKPQGHGWYISIVRSVDETDPVIRQLDLPTKNQNPVSASNTWLKGLLRSADDQLAFFQRENRHLATHVPNSVQRFMVETAQQIGQLSKESHKQLENVLNANKAAITYVNGKPIRGEAFRSQGALEREWRVRNGRLPTEQESLAYWTYHQLMDIDWALRNFAVHRDLARQGFSELYTVKAKFTVDGVERDGITAPGKFVHELPLNANSDFAVLVMEDGKPALHIWRDEMAGNLGKNLQAMLKNGYKAIQIANPMDRPFAPLFDKDDAASVHFVITRDSTSKPLPMNLVDRNPGVHIIYPQEHFVKQPIVKTGKNGRRVNYGDRNIYATETEVEAKRVAKAISEVQKMIRNKASDADIDAYIVKNLPEDVDFWRQQFRDYLDMDAPIVNTHSGKSTFDTHPELTKRPEYSKMFSERDSEWNGFRSVDMDFMSERDTPLMQIQNQGSIDKPLYVLEQARTVDPFAALNRALGNSIRHNFMNDYRTSAIEQWARQYGHLTDLGIDVAKSNPFHVFYNGELSTAKGDTLGVQEIHSAINTRARIKQFIGTQTEFGRDLDHFQTRIMNRIGEGKIARWYNDHEIRGLKDPVSAIRAMMYHYKFGLFNPKQFFVQAQGFTHITGVLVGAHGAKDGLDLAQKSMSAYLFHRAMDKTDQIAVKNALINKAVAMGWKREDFIEATRLLERTGFGIIGREHSLRDGVMDPNLWTTTGGKVLDAGGGFFKAGERLVREAGFYAAFLEWRRANPTKKMDQFTPGEILRRADDLSLNMTRASHSAIQEGFWRLPTQFYTFSHRIMEQFWGGRLTNKEKLAAFAGHSMIYGIPAAAGAVTLMPVYDMIRQQALLDGDGNVHNTFFKLATEGFISWMFWHLTGKEYNFGQRYGPGFSDQLTRLFGGELSVMAAAGGAAGSFIESMAKATYPFYAHVKAGLIGGQHSFPLAWNDILPMIKEVSSASDVVNTFVALNTQKYLSKAGHLLADDMTAMDAGALMFGLTRRDIQDARLVEFGVKDQEAHQRNMRNKAVQDLKVAYQYLADGNMSKAEAYFARAKVYLVVFGDMREAEIVRTITQVHKENVTLIQRARDRFLKEGYAGQLPRRLQMLIEQGK